MELTNYYPDDQLGLLLAYLRLGSKDVAIIRSDYRISADNKNDLKKAIVRHYLRVGRQYTPVEFTKIEWVIVILFFGLGENLNEASRIVEKPLRNVKLSYFSAKTKLLAMKG